MASVSSDLDTIFLIGGLSVLFNVRMTISEVREIENQEKRFLESGEIKYHLLNNFSYRIALLMIGIVLTMIVFSVGFFLTKTYEVRDMVFVIALMSVMCFVMWGYFTACVPKPPCKSKIRQWCEKAIQWFRDIREPAPVPEPSS